MDWANNTAILGVWTLTSKSKNGLGISNPMYYYILSDTRMIYVYTGAVFDLTCREESLHAVTELSTY